MATRLRYLHGSHKDQVAVLQDDVYASSLLVTGYAVLEPDPDAEPVAEHSAAVEPAEQAADESFEQTSGDEHQKPRRRRPS